MIPGIIKSRILVNKALLYKFPKQQGYMLSKLYSTKHDDDDGKQESAHDEQSIIKEETKEKPEPEIWELEGTESLSETPRMGGQYYRESEELRQALDMLHMREKETNKLIDRVIASSGSSTSASERILKMVIDQKSSPYRTTKPLPQSVVGSMHGRASRILSFKTQQPDDPRNDPLIDYLLPIEHDEYNWDRSVVSSNDHIVLKQEEMESAQAIVDAPTTLDLWHCIEREINRENYPRYYPYALTKAIEHASTMDPYMALTIFEKAKQKSIQSYISGCTVQVYNAMLALRWEVWRDVTGMLDLAEEMTVNGIEFDNNSRRIVRDVVQEIESEGSYSDNGAYDGVFWNAEERRNCNLMKELVSKWMILD